AFVHVPSTGDVTATTGFVRSTFRWRLTGSLALPARSVSVTTRSRPGTSTGTVTLNARSAPTVTSVSLTFTSPGSLVVPSTVTAAALVHVPSTGDVTVTTGFVRSTFRWRVTGSLTLPARSVAVATRSAPGRSTGTTTANVRSAATVAAVVPTVTAPGSLTVPVTVTDV